VRRRARHGRTRRVAWVTALVVVLMAATTSSVRALDSGSTPTVVTPGGLSATSWSAFCAQAARIQAAAEPGPAADPSLTTFRQFCSTLRARDGDALGGELVASDDGLRLLGSADSCTRVPRSTVDPATLVLTEVYSFSGSTSACVGGGTRQLAVVGRSAFVFDQGLYRATP
jgi:hypothetical protein